MTMHHTTLGFEIEYTRRSRNGGNVNLDDVLSNIREAGRTKNKPALANVSDQRGRYNTTFYTDRWVQGYDCSCGWEIKSQPTRDTDEVKEVMRGIRLAGGQVDSTCGLHIHVDIQHLTVEQIRRLCKVYARYEWALDRLLPKSRRAHRASYAVSNYITCRHTSGRAGHDLTDHFAALDTCDTIISLRAIANPRGKYSKMNLGPYDSKGTVEFRGHQGTLNFRKIDAWTSLLIAMLKKAEGTSVIEPKVASFAQMLDDLVGTEAQATTTVRRPGAGTKAGQVWDACDALFNGGQVDPRFFQTSTVSPTGYRTNHRDLLAYLLVALGTARGTTHVAITRWSQAMGMTTRPSDTRSGLRSYLEGRATELAARR